MELNDLKLEYRDINPGDCVTVRLSEAVCIQGCKVLAKSYLSGKVLYTVAVPTGIDSDPKDDGYGCVVNANVFIDGKYWVRWENLDSCFVVGD